jgi:hypothetical protein
MADKPRDLHAKFERDPAYGGAINAAVTVGTASTQVLQASSRRRRVTFVNDGATIIYLSKANTAQTATGIRLNANGGSYIDEVDPLGYLYAGPWSGISSANCNLCYIEEF